MISNLAVAKNKDKIDRGGTTEKMLINWRHYHTNTSTNTLYDNGMTTAFPYAYGTIPVPFNCYVTNVVMTANKYSTYGTPEGSSATVYVYKNLNTFVARKDLTYTGSEGMVLSFDFGDTAPIDAGEKITIRWYANGWWRYMASTIIITER